jgi:phage antirepressor YoqD-like protein
MLLIKQIPQNQQTMTSREIAELTEKNHADVLRDIRNMLEQLGTTASSFAGTYQVPGPNGSTRSAPCFELPKRESLILVSGYSIVLRARIIDRWQELEAGAMPTLPRTFSEALRALADKTEEAERQAASLLLAAPKVEFVDRYVDATGTQTFRQVSKLLQAKEPAFRAFLAARRILYQIGGAWTPYAEHIDAGRFVVKTGSADNGHAFSATRFTPKGVAWVSGLWLDAIGGAA